MKATERDEPPLILVLGRPGSGKSAFARALLRALSHPAALAMSDYSLLLRRVRSLGPEQVRWTPERQFEVLDRGIFDELLQELVSAALASRGKRPIVLEFSRDNYTQALKQFPEFVAEPPWIVYIDCPLETCIQRNAARAPGYPINVVPEAVIRMHYASDDLNELVQTFPGVVRRIDNSRHSLAALEREAVLLLAELRRQPAELARPVTTLGREAVVAGLVLGYTLGFAALAFAAWRAPGNSWLFSFAPEGGFPLLRTGLLVFSAGGLGSATYCMRALYHYYVRGLFDFDRFKWWYIFRPIAGAVLAVAAFALATGGAVALGTISGAASANNLTWFGVSYLAGFGTEQVIEWLRRASKSMFGESRVQPDDERPAG